MQIGQPQKQGPGNRKISFGQLAVKKGFASQPQVEDALKIQRSLVEETGKHKLIGMVMLEMGVLGTDQLIDILKELTTHPGATTAAIKKPQAAKQKK